MPAMNPYELRLNRINNRQSLHPILSSEYAHVQERQRKSFSDGHEPPIHIIGRSDSTIFSFAATFAGLAFSDIPLPFSEYKK